MDDMKIRRTIKIALANERARVLQEAERMEALGIDVPLILSQIDAALEWLEQQRRPEAQA